MTEQTFRQARQLRRTITQLERHILAGNARRGVGVSGVSREVSGAQLTTLLVIRDHGRISLKDLAKATQVSRPSASTMVDRLIELGMVERRPSQLDRREVRISLSELGTQTVDSLEMESLRSMADLLERLGPQYAQQWCDVSSRIEEVLEDGHSVATAQIPTLWGSNGTSTH